MSGDMFPGLLISPKVMSQLLDAPPYSGIDKGSYSWWQAKVDDSTAMLSLPAMRAGVGLLPQGFFVEGWDLT